MTLKSATGYTGSGSRDWIAQRISALILAAYTIVVLGWMIKNLPCTYEQWSGFMMTNHMKVFSTLAILSFIAHAWVGMWTVITDYIKPAAPRMIAEVLTIIAVLLYTIWTLQIFWG